MPTLAPWRRPTVSYNSDLTFGFFFFFFFLAFAAAFSCEQRGKATARFGDQRYRSGTGRRGVAWGGGWCAGATRLHP